MVAGDLVAGEVDQVGTFLALLEIGFRSPVLQLTVAQYEVTLPEMECNREYCGWPSGSTE